MIAHFTKMAMKALLRFKLHSVISMLSLCIGFLCFISAILIANYASSFDQGFPDSDKIFNIMIRAVGDSPVPDRFPIVNEPTARYLRTAFPEIPNIARASSGFPQAITYEGNTVALDTKYVESKFFSIFPLQTLHGLDAGESLPPNSVMLSEAGAIKIFGRTDVVGERLMIENRHDVVVAGVAKALDFPSHLEASIAFFNTELYAPIEIPEQVARETRIASGADPDADRWGNQSDFVYLKFPENMEVNVADFNHRLDLFVKETLPAERVEIQTFELLPIKDLVPTQMAFFTGGFDLTDILIVAGALVLLIGCLNYSNLVIAQLSLRSQEIGVQKILGAKRGLLLVQYAYESVLFVGMSLGVTLLILFAVLNRLQAAGVIGISGAMLLSPFLWLTLIGVIAIIIAIAGGYPAIRTAWVPLVSLMRPKGSSGYSGRLRGIMVGVQFFISGTLMILALIMFSQNSAMTNQLDVGQEDVKLTISVSTDTFTVEPELLAQQLKQHPSVLSVTQIDTLPWNISSSSMTFSTTRDINATTYEMARHWVGYDFSETMGQPLLGGRDFSRDRTTDTSPPVATISPSSGPFAVIIDDVAAKSFGWDNAKAAIGESVFRQIGPPTVPQEFNVEYKVIGAMSERKYEFIDFGAFGVDGNIYIQQNEAAQYMVVRLARDRLNEGLQHLDTTWNQLMPDVSLQREFVDDLFYNTYGLFLGVSLSIGSLSIFGFFVASIGLLGNATFITNIRQKEVGIRKVMGASSSQLLRMLLLDFAKPILIANALAWPLGYFIGNGYTSLFAARVEISLMPFIISLGLSALIAFAAVFSQSLKSARVRPATVLRYE
ncbi:MAG: putative ABC transport system permease protein [Pseudohongiellaceae bacterium]|jgi:putative ABC transport system permease protein